MMVNVYKVLDKDVKTKNNRTSKNDGSGSFWEREKERTERAAFIPLITPHLQAAAA